MPWRPANPPPTLRLNLNDRLSSIPASGHLNEIERTLDSKLGEPHIPTGKIDHRYMKDFYTACKRQVVEAFRSRKQPGWLLFFILASTSDCTRSARVF